MKKKDVNHLTRSELINLVYQMDKSNGRLQAPVSEQIKQERRKIRQRKAFRKFIIRTVSVLIVVAAISVLIATYWLPVLKVYGSSMSPTMEPGEVIVTVKSDAYKNGDIVAFWQGNKLLIKRVIAEPGQWVDIDSDGVVSVDGQNLNESYLSEKTKGTCDIELPHQVKESHLFLMGDNRESSLDSRTTFIGDVSKDQIESKILFRIWPVNKIGIVR
mgnify:FL=1